MIKQIKSDFEKLANPEKAKIYQRFFKTGPGEYGEGDVFIGLTVPEQRSLAKKYNNLSLDEIQELLNSKIHEHRLTGLLILVSQYNKNSLEIFNLYIKNMHNINNWDLVDLTAPKIVGKYLLDKPRDLLYDLAKSDNLWERRIAVLATFAFIDKKQFDDSIKIAEILLHDKHDLIHKAVGWMLREIGKRDQSILEEFLEKYHKKMPRTMLRYSIEKLTPEKRAYFMRK